MNMNQIIVYASMAFAAWRLYALKGMDEIIAIIALGAGGYFFYNNFIDKQEVKPVQVPVMGPTESFKPQEGWMYDEHNVPVYKIIPPRR